MARRCCLYEKGDEERKECTTDANCPNITGWTLIGNWGVEDCDDCWGSQGKEEEEPLYTTPDIERFGDVEKIWHWIKENWEKVFPHLPPLKELGLFKE